MNRTQISFALMLCLGACSLQGVQAQSAKPAAVRASLHRIMENAQAARNDASIYQWMRVNREVDRLVAAEHAIAKMLAADSAQKDNVTSLHDAVSELRKARLNHDVEQIKISADKVLAATETLTKANS